MKFMGLIEVSSVQVVDNEVLLLSIGGRTLEYVEVEPYVFEARDRSSRIAFVSRDGEMYVFSSQLTADHLRKVGSAERPSVHFAFLGGSLLIALSRFVSWTVSAPLPPGTERAASTHLRPRDASQLPLRLSALGDSDRRSTVHRHHYARSPRNIHRTRIHAQYR